MKRTILAIAITTAINANAAITLDSSTVEPGTINPATTLTPEIHPAPDGSAWAGTTNTTCVLWTPTSGPTAITPPTFTRCYPTSIDNAHTVTGHYQATPADPYHQFEWSPTIGFVDLGPTLLWPTTTPLYLDPPTITSYPFAETVSCVETPDRATCAILVRYHCSAPMQLRFTSWATTSDDWRTLYDALQASLDTAVATGTLTQENLDSLRMWNLDQIPTRIETGRPWHQQFAVGQAAKVVQKLEAWLADYTLHPGVTETIWLARDLHATLANEYTPDAEVCPL